MFSWIRNKLWGKRPLTREEQYDRLSLEQVEELASMEAELTDLEELLALWAPVHGKFSPEQARELCYRVMREICGDDTAAGVYADNFAHENQTYHDALVRKADLASEIRWFGSND